MNPFDCWYALGGTGSGVGSHPAYCEGYVRFLENFMRRHNIRRVVDWGCGDWQFSRAVDWTGIEYVGVDVVPDLIARLAAEYPSQLFTLADDTRLDHHIGAADLIICKDVFMHLPNAEVAALLERFAGAPHALITNNRQVIGPNTEGELGGYRALDLRRDPFNVAGREAYTFPPDTFNYGARPGWEKIVLHVERP
jgi:SAM-dependent methyltransferase